MKTDGRCKWEDSINIFPSSAYFTKKVSWDWKRDFIWRKAVHFFTVLRIKSFNFFFFTSFGVQPKSESLGSSHKYGKKEILGKSNRITVHQNANQFRGSLNLSGVSLSPNSVIIVIMRLALTLWVRRMNVTKTHHFLWCKLSSYCDLSSIYGDPRNVASQIHL